MPIVAAAAVAGLLWPEPPSLSPAGEGAQVPSTSSPGDGESSPGPSPGAPEAGETTGAPQAPSGQAGPGMVSATPAPQPSASQTPEESIRIRISSTPHKATVKEGEEVLGFTPIEITRRRTGRLDILLSKKGFVSV